MWALIVLDPAVEFIGNRDKTGLSYSRDLKRLFRGFRTKSDEIGAFPHQASCLTVFFLMIERDQAEHDRKSVAKTL